MCLVSNRIVISRLDAHSIHCCSSLSTLLNTRAYYRFAQAVGVAYKHLNKLHLRRVYSNHYAKFDDSSFYNNLELGVHTDRQTGDMAKSGLGYIDAYYVEASTPSSACYIH